MSEGTEEIFVTSSVHVDQAMQQIAKNGDVSFEAMLQLNEAGLSARGFSVLHILGRELGLDNIESVSQKLKRNMIEARTLLDALKHLAEPEASALAGQLSLPVEDVALLQTRASAAASMLEAAIATHGEVKRAAQGIIRDDEPVEDEEDDQS